MAIYYTDIIHLYKQQAESLERSHFPIRQLCSYKEIYFDLFCNTILFLKAKLLRYICKSGEISVNTFVPEILGYEEAVLKDGKKRYTLKWRLF